MKKSERGHPETGPPPVLKCEMEDQTIAGVTYRRNFSSNGNPDIK
jgi:hypothetical protein